jgi:hypothetical protein
VLIEELPLVTEVPERNLSEEIELSYAALIGFGYKELDNRGGNKISSLVAQTESKMARAPEKISVSGARVLSSSNDEGVLSDKDINTRTAKKPENTFQEQQTQLFELLLKQKQQPAQRNSWQLAHKYRKVLTKEQIQILEAKPIEQ